MTNSHSLLFLVCFTILFIFLGKAIQSFDSSTFRYNFLVMMETFHLERTSLDNFILGPFTINSEQYARQLVNLSKLGLILKTNLNPSSLSSEIFV